MTAPPEPLRDRWLPILALLVSAPICAEFLQAYLPSTGDLGFMVVALLIFAPLYGGAALLIREVAVRRGLGWAGLLLLAAGFGIAMPGLVDLALFAEDRPDIGYWREMRQATLIEPLGMSAHPTTSWVAGHVLMSVAAPVALVSALAPQHRGKPLLGRVGITVTVGCFLVAALLIRDDAISMYDYQPSLAQSAAVGGAVAVLSMLAFTRLGKPVSPGSRAPIRMPWLVLAAAVSMFTFDVLPWTWLGVALAVLLLAGAASAVRYLAATSSWSVLEIGALAAGAVIGRTLIGFLAPVAEGVSVAAKLTQNVILLSAAVVVAWLVTRRGRREGVAARGR
ncbi:hypothetical protein JQS43_03255 [Natronosporangium hydrolyticum]|uniref:Uncharacterized protein n=1 Tax=Natronosporangium hydrolyticum TaxID=2811111 RepID=A0A895YH26_9ACTN|nr:hypothetical protein [Natronosporangium hydrolyticum]QSB15392.1 hypothetical protein JQS43_03255 [Natronosporangium hydrolyticum]